MRIRLIVKQYIMLLTIGLLFLFCFSFYSYELLKVQRIYNQKAVTAIEDVQKSSKLNSAAQFIRYYDEVLTQSARNYAFTGDIKWKNRYEETVSSLDEKIQFAKTNDPAEQIFTQVDAANQALIAMEEASFAKVQAGDKAGAISILESTDYADQKNIYSQALIKYAQDKGDQYDQISSASTTAFSDITAAIKQAINQSLIFTILIILLVIAVLTVIGILITKIITRPLEILKKATYEIGKGNTCPQFSIKNKDEVGDLATAFTDMACRLSESRSEIERKVEEQTAKIKADSEKILKTQAEDEAYLSSIGDAVFAVDNSGSIILVNPQVEQLLGYPKEQLIGKNFISALPMLDKDEKQIPPEKRPITAVLKERAKKNFQDIFFVKADGTHLPVALTTAPIIKDGQVIGAIDVFRDITKERQIDKAKTEFVSLASHQLRTPLSAVNWYAEMLISGDAGKLTAPQLKYVKEIYSGNQRMVDLVNALLDVSRIELGTFAVSPEKTKVQTIAKDLIKELTPQIESKKIKLTEKYSPLGEILVDKKLIRIVLQNLMTNAIKYTPEKGKVNISILKKSPNMLISVSDTGYGIPKAQQNHIFEKLFRADNIRQKSTEGTGLGLYIAKAIIDQSNGKIWFESRENKGTTFFVSLPLKGMQKKEGTKALEDIK